MVHKKLLTVWFFALLMIFTSVQAGQDPGQDLNSVFPVTTQEMRNFDNQFDRSGAAAFSLEIYRAFQGFETALFFNKAEAQKAVLQHLWIDRFQHDMQEESLEFSTAKHLALNAGISAMHFYKLALGKNDKRALLPLFMMLNDSTFRYHHRVDALINKEGLTNADLMIKACDTLSYDYLITKFLSEKNLRYQKCILKILEEKDEKIQTIAAAPKKEVETFSLQAFFRHIRTELYHNVVFQVPSLSPLQNIENKKPAQKNGENKTYLEHCMQEALKKQAREQVPKVIENIDWTQDPQEEFNLVRLVDWEKKPQKVIPDEEYEKEDSYSEFEHSEPDDEEYHKQKAITHAEQRVQAAEEAFRLFRFTSGYMCLKGFRNWWMPEEWQLSNPVFVFDKVIKQAKKDEKARKLQAASKARKASDTAEESDSSDSSDDSDT